MKRVLLIAFLALTGFIQSSAKTNVVFLDGMSKPEDRDFSEAMFSLYSRIEAVGFAERIWYLAADNGLALAKAASQVSEAELLRLRAEVSALTDSADVTLIFLNAHGGGLNQDTTSWLYGRNVSPFPVVVSELDTVKNRGRGILERDLVWRDEADTTKFGPRDLNADGDLDDFVYITESVRLGADLLSDYRLAEILLAMPGKKILFCNSCYGPLTDNFFGSEAGVYSATDKFSEAFGRWYLSYLAPGFSFRQPDAFTSPGTFCADAEEDGKITVADLQNYVAYNFPEEWAKKFRYNDSGTPAEFPVPRGWREFVPGEFSNSTVIVYGQAHQGASIAGRETKPLAFSLAENFPNPFNSETTIDYVLPRQTRARLAVYDTRGQEVAKLVDGETAAGLHQISFRASGLASGVYFYLLETDTGFRQVRKMLLVK
jgi:hypothetical protein